MHNEDGAHRRIEQKSDRRPHHRPAALVLKFAPNIGSEATEQLCLCARDSATSHQSEGRAQTVAERKRQSFCRCESIGAEHLQLYEEHWHAGGEEGTRAGHCERE